MADDRTTWTIEFKEQGLDGTTRKVEVFQDSLGRLREVNGRFASEQIKAAAAAQGLGTQISGLTNHVIKSNEAFNIGIPFISAFGGVAGVALRGLVEGATAAAAALSKLDDRAVKAFGERTSTIRAYTTILGDAKQAQIEYATANELASKTELTSASTLKAQQALIVAGFRGKDLTNALTASMDVAATKQPEEREMTMERMGRAFSQILAAGKLRGQELNQLAEAGVNRGQVLELLGKGNAGAGEKAMSAGQVSAQQGIAAVQQAILQTLGTKQLGQFAAGASGSMAGLLSNRDEALDILLKAFEGETLPAVKAYKTALADQTTQLSTTSETGKGLVMMLSDFASITTNVKAIWTDFTTGFLETFVQSYNASRENSGAFVAMTAGVKALGQALGYVGSIVGSVANGFEWLLSAITNGLERLRAAISPIASWLSNFLSKTGEALSEFDQGNFKAAFSRMGSAFVATALKDEGPRGKTLADYQAEDDEREAANFDRLLKESQWAAFKRRQAAGFPAEEAPTSATVTRWGKGGEAGGVSGRGGSGGGFDVTALMTGGGSSGSRLQASVDAAAAVSSAPSAQAQAMASMGSSSAGAAAASVNVTVAPGAIVINGVSDPVAAADEAMRLLGQHLGRLHRAPSVATGL